MMERRKNNVLKKEERQKRMERRINKIGEIVWRKRDKRKGYSILLISYN